MPLESSWCVRALRSEQITELHAAHDHAKSVARLGVVVEEADETMYWLELLMDAEIVSKERLTELMKEARELTAIFTAAQRTTRKT